MADKPISSSPDNKSDPTEDFLTLAEAQIKRDEGLCLKPYRDLVGVLTIGFGRNLENGISESEAAFLLENDLETATKDAAMCLGDEYFQALSPVRKAALVNMAFNLGRTRLLGFRLMLELMRQGRFDAAADAALQSKWATQVKGRAIRIAQALRQG